MCRSHGGGGVAVFESVPKVFSNPTWNREVGNSILEDEGDF